MRPESNDHGGALHPDMLRLICPTISDAGARAVCRVAEHGDAEKALSMFSAMCGALGVESFTDIDNPHEVAARFVHRGDVHAATLFYEPRHGQFVADSVAGYLEAMKRAHVEIRMAHGASIHGESIMVYNMPTKLDSSFSAHELCEVFGGLSLKAARLIVNMTCEERHGRAAEEVLICLADCVGGEVEAIKAPPVADGMPGMVRNGGGYWGDVIGLMVCSHESPKMCLMYDCDSECFKLGLKSDVISMCMHAERMRRLGMIDRHIDVCFDICVTTPRHDCIEAIKKALYISKKGPADGLGHDETLHFGSKECEIFYPEELGSGLYGLKFSGVYKRYVDRDISNFIHDKMGMMIDRNFDKLLDLVADECAVRAVTCAVDCLIAAADCDVVDVICAGVHLKVHGATVQSSDRVVSAVVDLGESAESSELVGLAEEVDVTRDFQRRVDSGGKGDAEVPQEFENRIDPEQYQGVVNFAAKFVRRMEQKVSGSEGDQARKYIPRVVLNIRGRRVIELVVTTRGMDLSNKFFDAEISFEKSITGGKPMEVGAKVIMADLFTINLSRFTIRGDADVDKFADSVADEINNYAMQGAGRSNPEADRDRAARRRKRERDRGRRFR